MALMKVSVSCATSWYMFAGRTDFPLRSACSSCSQHDQSEASKRIMSPAYCVEPDRRYCLDAAVRLKRSVSFSNRWSAVNALSNNSASLGSSRSAWAIAFALLGSACNASKTFSSTAVWTIRASTWPLASDINWEKFIGERLVYRERTLEFFDDPVAPALGFERGDDIILHHQANVPIGDVAIDFSDPFVFGGGEGFAVTIGVGQQAALT